MTYLHGYYLEDKNDFKAQNYFRKSIKNGMPEPAAAYWLGFMYETGRGVEKDQKKALEMYRIAAKAGNKEALEKLKSLGEPITTN
ncbi:hypothetical protein NB640_11930 [Oxalobacter vibrioformis]|uniref:Beta-lactamase n=2 Tax=Oxalobacter vibrioformis TaxID=933080 RepID=A0A9E9P2H6_9BURK|nr:hypothetical protein NB640_11930 [Oxalobacter vibrioformis]